MVSHPLNHPLWMRDSKLEKIDNDVERKKRCINLFPIDCPVRGKSTPGNEVGGVPLGRSKIHDFQPKFSDQFSSIEAQ